MTQLTCSLPRTTGPSVSNLLTFISTHPNLTPFQKKVLSLITQIPRGRFTTYGAIATFLHSSPRAVGNALSVNPFAYAEIETSFSQGEDTKVTQTQTMIAPCHRVVTSTFTIGGFGGDTDESSSGIKLKRKVLAEEGVEFGPTGKVIGEPWTKFV